MGERQEAQRIGYVAAAFADNLSQTFLRVFEFIDQPLVTRGFFKRIQIGALNVLNKGDFKHALIA